MPRLNVRMAYKFEELSEEAKQEAISKLRTIDVDYDWWEFTYEDAESIGLNITSFSLGFPWSMEGDFTENPEQVADNIIRDHGKECETYKSAKWCKEELFLTVARGLTLGKEEEEISEDITEVERQFLNILRQNYQKILSEEYDHRISDEAVIETIMANDYEFDEDGSLI